MDPQVIWFFTLLLCGLFLIGAEVFIPGGVLGIAGGAALLAAGGMGFVAFDPPWNLLAALSIIFLSAVFMYLWIRYFPKTRMGKSLTLDEDGADFHATHDRHELVGAEGTVVTDLRPAGIALFGKQRIDVVAEGGWIPKDSSVKVIRAEGNVITVRVNSPESA